MSFKYITVVIPLMTNLREQSIVLFISSKLVVKTITSLCSLYTLSKIHSDKVVFPIPALPSIIKNLFSFNSEKNSL